MGQVEGSLVVCEQCGLAHRWQPLGDAALARCSRCEAVLGRAHRLSIGSVLALTVAAGAAYLIAINTPLMSLSLRGGSESATLVQAISTAWQEDQQFVAVLAAVTALLAPAAFVALRLYVLLPLAAGSKPPGFAWCVRLLHQADRWNMIEVFTVGVLLSLVRLSGLADAAPGPGLFALGAVTVLFAAIQSAGLKHLWWQVR
ncbi:MAG TPA: paraquat-inducible protein A [Caldimonas sp.]|jgi:paraquat-inducible protein A|nr:paraquat-inducible protein A [Caldimonas sp.]